MPLLVWYALAAYVVGTCAQHELLHVHVHVPVYYMYTIIIIAGGDTFLSQTLVYHAIVVQCHVCLIFLRFSYVHVSDSVYSTVMIIPKQFMYIYVGT